MLRLNCLSQVISHSPSPATQEQDVVRKYKNYQICVMKPHHKQQVYDIYINDYLKRYPLLIAYSKKYSITSDLYQEQKDYWKRTVQQLTTNGYSLVAKDMRSGEIVACVALIDHPETPIDLQSEEHTHFVKAEDALAQALIAKAPANFRAIQKAAHNQRGVTGFSFGLVCKDTVKDYGVVTQLMEGISQQKLKDTTLMVYFAFGFNGRTIQQSKNINVYQVATMDAKEFEFKGENPFQFIEERSRYLSLLRLI